MKGFFILKSYKFININLLDHVNSDGIFLGVGIKYLHDSWVVSWFSHWFLGLFLGSFVMTSNKKVKSQIWLLLQKNQHWND